MMNRKDKIAECAKSLNMRVDTVEWVVQCLTPQRGYYEHSTLKEAFNEVKRQLVQEEGLCHRGQYNPTLESLGWTEEKLVKDTRDLLVLLTDVYGLVKLSLRDAFDEMK